MSEGRAGWRYFIEHQTPHTSVMHEVKRVLYSGRSKYQQIDVIETHDFGLCLVLDGKMQSSMVDEWMYHEALVHPAMVTHPRPLKVAVIGGGEGATAREVLRHGCVKEVVMVDLDEEVVRVSLKYLGRMGGRALKDPRLTLIYGDGRRFVEETDRVFDVVVVDVTDPLSGGPSYLLYTKEFYEHVYRRLGEEGLMVTQATSTFYSQGCFTAIYRTVATVFPIARAYHVWVPSYNATWGFVIGSKAHDPAKLGPKAAAARLRERGVKGLKFYTPKLHRSLFTLPKYLERALKAERRVIRDSEPVFMPA
ncbi:spermidine synthase [Candidatus Geothermarchaeota archaeon ex4572_27]|nr:MAG: spermidine synthase [Candidatus Geothermarchaeota archaeon ex4572_27]